MGTSPTLWELYQTRVVKHLSDHIYFANLPVWCLVVRLDYHSSFHYGPLFLSLRYPNPCTLYTITRIPWVFTLLVKVVWRPYDLLRFFVPSPFRNERPSSIVVPPEPHGLVHARCLSRPILHLYPTLAYCLRSELVLGSEYHPQIVDHVHYRVCAHRRLTLQLGRMYHLEHHNLTIYT